MSEIVSDVSTPLDMTRKQKAYASAGVDVDLGNKLKRRIHSLVRQTHGPQVLGKIGGFGGLFRANFGAMRDPVLVEMIDGSRIKRGDVVLGLPSNGLHTNGYSLARKILFEKMKLKPSSRLPGSTTTVGSELLRVHKNYQPLLAKVPSGMIKGLAHITGGGLVDNVPRILPSNCDAIIETKSWRVPRIFQNFQQNGNIDAQEMYQVFNKGI